MKRIIAVLSILLAFYMPVFAQTEESEPDNGNVQTEEENIEQNEDSDDENIVRKENDYKVNGRGDQFIKIGLMPNFPMNFGDKLYVGGAAQLGYYHFFTSWFAIGGELMAGYNPTLGSNVLTFVPVTTGVMFQPSFRRFVFPVFLSAGFGFETCANKKYFPGFAAKAEAGVFFRIVESWSVGLSGQYLYLPQWYTDTKNADSDYGVFTQIAISGRYHF